MLCGSSPRQASWLYATGEDWPATPHDRAAWAAWYLGRLARADGWTLLACVGAGGAEAPAVPRYPPVPFPSWCLAARRGGDPRARAACAAPPPLKEVRQWSFELHLRRA